MAIISSSITTVDIVKLKTELESLVDSDGKKLFRVISITPQSGTEATQVNLTLIDGTADLGAHASLAQTTIDAHQSSQRLRVLIQDLPDLDDAASNKTYVDQKIASLVDSAPTVLDTLNELAQALGNDANFSTTITTAIGELESRLDSIEVSGISGSGTQNKLPKFGTSNTLTDSLVYDDGSKVGIGTTSPQKLLDVSADVLINGVTIGRGGGNNETNTVVGQLALQSNTTGNSNVAIGTSTLKNNTTGYANIAIGQDALLTNTAGAFNVAIGHGAMYSHTTGSVLGPNVGVGPYALYNLTSGYRNTAVGPNAMIGATSAYECVGIGWNALVANTTGYMNTAVGAWSLATNTTGSFNSAFGWNSLNQNTTGFSNTAIGQHSMSTNTTGSSNTSVGQQALRYNTTGGRNVAVGLEALLFNTASENTAVGTQSMRSNTTGNLNAALGFQALYTNTTGYSNTAIGNGALYTTTTGYDNTAVGTWALRKTTGALNVSVGSFSLRENTTGSNNVAVGQGALINSTTGSRNVALGPAAGSSILTGSNNVIIGGNTASHVNGRTGCISISDGAGVERIFIDESGVTDIKGTLTVNGVSVAGQDISVETVLNNFSTALSPISNTLTLNLALGKVVLGALSDSVTTWAFTNAPTDNGKAVSVTVMLEGNSARTYGDACSVNGIAVSGGVKWVSGSAPVATNNTDIITFVIVKDNSGAIKVIGNATLNIS